MRSRLLAFVAIVSLASVGSAFAASVSGAYCRIGDFRFNNGGEGTVREKVWEYAAAKLPADPVMGTIDVACADRGEPRAAVQDFGKRVWFNVSGAASADADKGTLSVSDSDINSSVRGYAGIAVKGLAIYGVITSRHDCTYQVMVWQEKCAAK